MDGPWQIGHMFATEYGLKASDAARQMRYVDPSLKLIACGSSGPGMPTYLEWDREVSNSAMTTSTGFRYTAILTTPRPPEAIALNSCNDLTMDRQIAETVAVCDLVRGHKRSPKKLWLSFDEWNVWYANAAATPSTARKPKPLTYLKRSTTWKTPFSSWLAQHMIRNSDRVKLACPPTDNVIAPIMTNADGLFRQTIYYPYNWALQFARGAAAECSSGIFDYDVKGLDQVPHLDVAASHNAAEGSVTAFILNRDLQKPTT